MSGKILKRSIIVIAIVLLGAYIGFQAYASSSGTVSVETALTHSVEETITTSGLAVRKETILTYDGAGKLSYAVEDAGHTASGGVLAYVYGTEEEAQAKNEINRLNREIAAIQEIQKSVFPGSISIETMDMQIDEWLLKVAQTAYGQEFGEMTEAKERLVELLNKRQIVTGQELDFNSTIQVLTAERDAIASRYPGGTDTLTAPMSGYFYSQADGYEGAVDLDRLENMTVSGLMDVLDRGPAAVASNVYGKLANTYEWYYLCPIPSENAKGYQRGDTVEMRVPFLTSSALAMTVVSVGDNEDGQALLVLRGGQFSAELASFRDQQVTLAVSRQTGLRVNLSAVHFVDGKMGVYILEGIAARFVTIEPVWSGETYLLVRSDGGAGTLELYDEIIVKGRDMYDGKVVRT